MQSKQQEESKTQGRDVSMDEIKEKYLTNAWPVKLDDAEQSPENLITYKEFIQALKSAKKGLYYKILPRTLSFLAVVES